MPEYIEGSDPPDATLSLDGELVGHLRKLVEAGDTSAYVMQTKSEYFPHVYPEPPRQEGPICREELLKAYCGTEYVKKEMPEKTVEWYMERSEVSHWHSAFILWSD